MRNGVLEYWSIGLNASLLHHSTTPVFTLLTYLRNGETYEHKI